MEVGLFKRLERAKIVISAYLILSIFVSLFGEGLLQKVTPIAEAAEVTIDSDVSTTVEEQLQSGTNIVFINDQTGYKFFVDAPGYCVYRKTTNGGSTWGATTTVDSQPDCAQISVWYDKWTPGSASSSIHIATIDVNPDAIWYNRLDTNGDTLLLGTSPVNMETGSAQGGTSNTAGENFVSITRATDGTIYAISNDGSGNNDSYVVECTVSCNVTGNWTERTTLPLDVASDQNILMPLAGGDIMIIQRDISANLLRSRVWDESAGTWLAWTTIDPNQGGDNTTYDVGFSATVSSSTPGYVYLAYAADYDVIGGANEDVRVGFYDGTSWSTSTLTNVISNSATRAITGVAIAIDTSTEDVYVAYAAQTTAAFPNTANVYWKTATSSMQNWSVEQGPVNVGADDIYGVSLNNASDERIFISWYEAASDDIYGDTIADIYPGVGVSTNGSQTATVNASTTQAYLGGSFVFRANYKSHDITAITLTESGTIDGSQNLKNIRLYYEQDASSPFTCASETYAGTESQFGSADVNGFSGADGVSSFTGSSFSVSSTSVYCVYVVADVIDTTENAATIDISIANPSSDVTVTGGTASPQTAQNITGTTQVLNDEPTLVHYHWRNDDASEAAATSKTSGTEDTALAAMQQNAVTRLRMEVSNEGGSTTPSMQYRLEYAPNPSTCDVATGWTDVGAAGGDFDMAASSNLTEGADTTNIATGIGGVTNENTTFLTPNGGVRETSSQTGGLTLSSTQYVELEYSIMASTSATEGNTYCFRLTDQGNALFLYSQYPRANISADVLVTASGTQTTSTTTPATNFYVGGKFVITENTGSRNVTSMTITENGTADGLVDLDNIKIYYDLDTSLPYDCGSETYVGGETQFGSTDTDGFSWANGSSTFTGTAAITTTATMCAYVVLDSTATAQNGETINIIMESPSTNLVVSGGGSVSPGITREITGETTLVGSVLTQTHYHWRNDNGSEATASSSSGGVEDTPISNISQATPVRLRVQVSNEGSVTSASRAYTIEYGAKISTCSAVATWINVGDTGGAWNMYNSANLTDGGNTTDIALNLGGVTDENTTFLTPNSAIKDTSSTIASTTLSSTQYLEAEFSMQQTVDAGFDVTYCFRLTTTQVALDAYTTYAELTTAPERDFEIQRRTETITGTTLTITAGVDYVAPSASTSAFIRITNSHHTGAGSTAAGATQNADDTTVYIQNPSNIMNSITFVRIGAAGNTRVSWEIVEFIGEAGSDNEMIVRQQGTMTYTTTSFTATTSAVSGIVDDADVAVLITGQGNPDTTTGYNSGQSTSAWLASSNQAVFTRDTTGNDAVIVSYAVIEFTGMNWAIQRSEHTYSAAGTTETEAITAVNSLERAFIHTQKRMTSALTGVDEFGHEVWLSSIGQLSFFIESGATTPSGQTSVVWVFENTQTSSGAMVVSRSNGSPVTGTAPFTLSVDIGPTLSDITNASLFVNTRAAGTGTNFPRPIVGAIIASTTDFQLWRSNTGSNLAFRAEVVEWPTAGLAVRQNIFGLYVDNNALLPTVAWPGQSGPLGENDILTSTDNPLGEGERIRIRMTLRALNATLPAGTRAFRLQYGVLTTTCGAISESSWNTLGNSASSTIWRGYNAPGVADGTQLSGDPPTGGDLLLTSASDVAGTFEEENDTAVNTYAVSDGEDIEYDWLVEQNGANADTYYCFRMIDAAGSPLDSYSSTYPQIRTASFTPRTQNWRWYDDETNVTPTVALASENVAPVDIANTQAVKLRVTVKETKNIAQEDTRFKLQYSEYANFSTSTNLTIQSECTATSTWCYEDGGGIDNAEIPSKVLTDADSCSAGVGDGCGTHNESPDILTGFRHGGGDATEYEFTILSAAPRVNRVYYFRLFDLVQNLPVPINTGEAYPSLVTEGGSLVFAMEGLNASTVLEGVTLDISTTPTTIPFGTVPVGTFVEGAHRLAIDTNGTQGYQVFMLMTSDLMSAGGATIDQVTGTNASPSAWATGCSALATSCFGYHTSDDTLYGGSTRFSAIDTYAQINTSGALEEVGHSSQPAIGDSVDVVFRLFVRQFQDAGIYEANIQYVSVPMF